MNKTFSQKARVVFPVNVRILQKDSNNNLVRSYVTKNMVLKEYGLYGYIRFLLGSFQNNSLLDQSLFVPKYLAVGTNDGEATGAPGVDTVVKVSDTSLYHEIIESGSGIKTNRIPLNRNNYIEDTENQNYLKIQYEAYIPENRFVNSSIGELALMTEKTGNNAFARVAIYPPIQKEVNQVIQVIWEISVVSVESSSKLSPPIKTYLREAVEKGIDVLCNNLTVDSSHSSIDSTKARKALNQLIQPATLTEEKGPTGLYLLLNDNEQITQDVVNEYLSKPFESLENTGLIPLINIFDPAWKPTGSIID